MHRILIIDDEEDVLIPLKNLLEKEGFQEQLYREVALHLKLLKCSNPM